MQISIIKEENKNEQRVSSTPDAINLLLRFGAEVLIEQRNKNPRRLTPLEGLRLMGFDHIEKQFKDPKEIFSVSDSQAFRQLGNAVVPGVVEAVGREVLRTLENN